MSKFNRFEILGKKYKAEIEGWDWAKIKRSAQSNCFVEDDQVIASTFLGTVFGIYPSGKFYTCWTSNQTRADTIKDEAFHDALEEVAESHGLYITSGEGDPCDIFARFAVDGPEDVIQYVCEGDHEEAQVIFEKYS